MTNIFNMFLGEYWRLKTSPRPFYYFIKMTIYQDLAIFNSCRLPFWIVPYSPFQKNETLESLHNWLWNNWGQLLNWKEPGTYPPVRQIVQKIPENYCPRLYLSIGKVWWLNELWSKRYIQKYTLFHILMLIMTS